MSFLLCMPAKRDHVCWLASSATANGTSILAGACFLFCSDVAWHFRLRLTPAVQPTSREILCSPVRCLRAECPFVCFRRGKRSRFLRQRRRVSRRFSSRQRIPGPAIRTQRLPQSFRKGTKSINLPSKASVSAEVLPPTGCSASW
jgi:hypothetical protein